MKKSIPFFLVLVSFVFSKAQSGDICQALLAEEFSLVGFEIGPVQSQKIAQFNECFLDSIDVKILWNATVLTPFIISDTNASDSASTTFKDLLEHFDSVKKMDFYQEIRSVYDDLAIIAELKVLPENWKLVESVLTHAQVPSEKIEEIRLASLLDENLNLTYKELLESLKQEREQSNPNSGLKPPTDYKVIEDNFFSKSEFDYAALLSQSKQEGKSILFYFTGYGCINAVKMERMMLSQPGIKQLINRNYILVPLYVDDKERLDQEETTKEGRLLKTVGQRNANFQMEKFQSNQQPYFVIMNGEELILGRIGYSDQESFEQFLAKAK